MCTSKKGGRKDGDQQLEQDPVVSEQAPRGSQCLDKPRHSRGDAERHDHEPAGQLHREIGSAHQLRILTCQTGNGEREEGGHRANPVRIYC